jgi:hypothetical protein
MFYVGIYPDVDTAEHDYQAVKDLYYEMNLIDTFDSAVVGKNESGNVEIYRKHEQPTRHGGRVGAWRRVLSWPCSQRPPSAAGLLPARRLRVPAAAPLPGMCRGG